MTEHQTITSEPEQIRLMVVRMHGPRTVDVYELINYYRLLKQETWNVFILKAVAEYIGLENDMIKDAVYGYLYRPKKARKKGTGRKPGVRLTDEQKKHISERMKLAWAVRKRMEAERLEKEQSQTT